MSTPLYSDFLNSGFVFSNISQPGSPRSYWLGWGKPLRQAQPTPTIQGQTHPLGGLWVYAPDFFLKDPEPWWWFPEAACVEESKLLADLRDLGTCSPQRRTPDPQADSSKTEFCRTFAEIQNALASGLLKKAVPVVFEDYPGTLLPSERGALLLHLLEAVTDSPLMVYGIWNIDEGMLGATPEVLFDLHPEGEVQTMALAGTRKKGIAGPSLLEDPKEMDEHRIVIQGIRESFDRIAKKLGPGDFKAGVTTERELPTLVHLHTALSWMPYSESLMTREQIFETLVQELHPTPALGAFPREAGWAWLKSQEALHERGRFGAPFAVFLGGERVRCVVCIRNIQWNAQTIRMGAGCGIVAQSQVEREWAELGAKIQSIQKLLGL